MRDESTTISSLLLPYDDRFLEMSECPSWVHVPEKRLLFGVIERAVRDCLGTRIPEAKDASIWLFGSDSPEVPFSFAWVCQQLDIMPDDIRNKINALKRASRLEA